MKIVLVQKSKPINTILHGYKMHISHNIIIVDEYMCICTCTCTCTCIGMTHSVITYIVSDPSYTMCVHVHCTYVHIYLDVRRMYIMYTYVMYMYVLVGTV